MVIGEGKKHRSQKSEVRSQKTEVRRQKSEDRSKLFATNSFDRLTARGTKCTKDTKNWTLIRPSLKLPSSSQMDLSRDYGGQAEGYQVNRVFHPSQ